MRDSTGGAADNNNYDATLFSSRLYKFTINMAFCLQLGLGLGLGIVLLRLGFGLGLGIQ